MGKIIGTFDSRTIMRAGVCLVLFLAVTMSASMPEAKNYVNWKGGFWLSIPDNWEKVDYWIVDRYLSMTDTSREIFNYEALFAPRDLEYFHEDAYLVVTFDSTGALNEEQADSVLESIAGSYSEDIDDAPIVQYMTDLVPGRPQIDRDKKAVTVLSEMAYRPDAMKKLWLYMRLNQRGLISLYFYSPDSTFERNQPVFEDIVESLSFENLQQASEEELVFTDIGGEDIDAPEARSGEDVGDGDGGGSLLPYLVLILIVVYLIWRFAIAPRRRMKNTRSE